MFSFAAANLCKETSRLETLTGKDENKSAVESDHFVVIFQ